MQDNASNNRRIAINSIFMSIRMVIVLLITLYTTRAVLQVLGVVDYGVYNVVCGFVAMFGFLNTSMSNGIQRFFNFEYGKSGEDGANRVYCTSIYIQALLAVIVVVFVESFGLWYLHNKMVIPVERFVAAEWIFHLSVISFVIGIMQAPFSAAVTAHEKFNFYAVISVLDALLKLGIVFLIRWLSADKLVMYGVFFTIVSHVNIGLYYIYCKINFAEISFKRNFDKKLFKEMLGFSGWNLFGSFSGVMENHGINLVLNFFFGPVVNAARGVANQISGGVQSFIQNITIPVRPQVTQSYAKGEVQRSISLTYGVSKLSCAFVLLLGIPISLEIDYVLMLWLGDNIPAHTSTFTILILLTAIFNNLNSATSGIVHATGVMKQYQVWGSLVRICSVHIAYILIKLYDIPALALIAVLVSAAFTQLVCIIIASKLVNFSLSGYFKQVVCPILLILVIGTLALLPIHILMPMGFLRLIIICVSSLVVIGILFYFIAFNKNERNMVLLILKPVLSFLNN